MTIAESAVHMKPRPTMYKGIRMRSRLEAGFAGWLDSRGLRWEYEPCAFGAEAGQYLPDFRVHDVYDAHVAQAVTAYVEVKPQQPVVGDLCDLIGGQPYDASLAILARRMEVVWGSEPAASLLLLWPGLVDDEGLAALRLFQAGPGVGAPSIFLPTLLLGSTGLTIGRPVPNRNRPWPDQWWNPAR